MTPKPLPPLAASLRTWIENEHFRAANAGRGKAREKYEHAAEKLERFRAELAIPYDAELGHLRVLLREARLFLECLPSEAVHSVTCAPLSDLLRRIQEAAP